VLSPFSVTMLTHTTTIRVRYADTDQMKSVYYGKFFEYFEQARTDLLRSLGLPYAELERMGYFLPVVEAFAKYHRSARYDDLVRVETSVAEMPVARIRLRYTVRREGEEDLLAEGYTVHAFVHASSGKPTRAPMVFLQTLEEAVKHERGRHASKGTS
jgi:acyl-CoA thioester hydrolase